MNKNTMIVIVVIVIAVIAISYFNRGHNKSENMFTEAGHEMSHELDEIGDNIKDRNN